MRNARALRRQPVDVERDRTEWLWCEFVEPIFDLLLQLDRPVTADIKNDIDRPRDDQAPNGTGAPQLCRAPGPSWVVPPLEVAVAGPVVLEGGKIALPVGVVVRLEAIGVDPMAAKHL